MNNINAMGDKFKIIRNGVQFKETIGLIHYPGTKKEFIGFNPDEDLQIGDTLIRILTNKEYIITEIQQHTNIGLIDQLMIYCN